MAVMTAISLSQSTDRTRSRSLFWPVTIFALVLTLLLVRLEDQWLLGDPDTFWHIAVGRWMWTHHGVPWVDEFSFTFKGQPWIAKEWLAQLLLAAAYDGFEWKGVVLLAAGAIAATFALLFAALTERMRVIPALIAVLFMYVLSMPHFAARPHILSYPLLVLWVAGVVRARDEQRLPSFFLLPIMTVWANVHGGFTLGLAIALALAGEAVLESERKERGRTALQWAVFVGAAVVASLITPYGYHSLYVTYQLFGGNEAVQLVDEWKSFSFADQAVLGRILMLALFSSLFFGVKLPLVRSALVVSLIYMAMLHIRVISVVTLVVPLLMAAPLTRQFRYLSSQNEEWKIANAGNDRVLTIGAALYVVVACLTYASFGVPLPTANTSPVAAVDYIEVHGWKDARIFNDYDFGGYLIFRGIPTFIDGRTDQLFVQGFMRELGDAIHNSQTGFLDLLDRYHVALALLKPGSPAARRLKEAATWRPVYSDDVGVIYARQGR